MKTFKELRESLKDSCWKGYEAIGTKKKNGKTVPNCVPVKESYEEAQKHLDKASKALETSDMHAHHQHMANHFETLGKWHESKGRSDSAQKAYDKAEEHHEKSLKEEVEQIDEMDKSQPSSSRGAEGLATGTKAEPAKYKNMKKSTLATLRKAFAKKNVKEEVVNERGGGPSKWKSEVERHHGEVTYRKKEDTGTGGLKPKRRTIAYNNKGNIVGVYHHHYKEGSIFEQAEQLDERGEDSKGYKRSTESGAGLTRKGAKAMGVKTAVTTPPSKLDPEGKAAKRRKSFCARMSGMKGPMKDEKGRPTRKAMSLRRWNC